MAYVITDDCVSCGTCAANCPVEAIDMGDDKYVIDQDKCIGCKSCLRLGCPAISFDAGTKKAKIDRVACAGCGVCAQVCKCSAIREA